MQFYFFVTTGENAVVEAVKEKSINIYRLCKHSLGGKVFFPKVSLSVYLLVVTRHLSRSGSLKQRIPNT